MAADVQPQTWQPLDTGLKGSASDVLAMRRRVHNPIYRPVCYENCCVVGNAAPFLLGLQLAAFPRRKVVYPIVKPRLERRGVEAPISEHGFLIDEKFDVWITQSQDASQSGVLLETES